MEKSILKSYSTHLRSGSFIWYNGEIIEGRIFKTTNHLNNNNNEAYYLAPTNSVNLLQIHNREEHIYSKSLKIDNLNSIQFQYNGTLGNDNDDSDKPKLRRKYKKLIILGAGASFDASPQLKGALPLTDGLFQNVEDHFFESYRAIRALQPKFNRGGSLEEQLERLWQQTRIGFHPILVAELVALQYYFHEFFFAKSEELKDKADNHKILANHIREITLNGEEGVAIISFNYDTLMESAIETAFGIEFNNSTDYINDIDKPAIVFKPHGSCNWVKEIIPNLHFANFQNQNLRAEDDYTEIYNRLNKALPTNHLKFISAIPDKLDKKEIYLPDLLNHLSPEFLVVKKDGSPLELSFEKNKIRGKKIYFPQLLNPFKAKDEFVMPNNHLITLKEILRDIQEVAVIGWKGSEAKFNKLLNDHLTRNNTTVTWYNGSDSNKSVQNSPFTKPNINNQSGTSSFSMLADYLAQNNSLFSQNT